MGEASQSFQQTFALARHAQLRDALFGLGKIAKIWETKHGEINGMTGK
jgi:hypothetical protein